MDQTTPPNDICIRTLHEHTECVFGLQFDDKRMITASNDEKMIVWDFMNEGDENN